MVGRTGLVVAVAALALGACGTGEGTGLGSGEDNVSVPSPSDSAGASSPMSSGPLSSVPSSSVPLSPSDLPILGRATAPPSAPTDAVPRGVLAGRVTALSDTCTEVTTDDDVAWSLVGDVDVELEVGDTVIARLSTLDADDESCGPGRAARLVSIRVVGQA